MSIDNTPWTARQYQRDTYTYNWEVVGSDGEDIVLCCTKEQGLLLAAAPDLLESLEQCLRHIEQDESTHGRPFAAGNMARAAIAKSRGEK